MFILGMPAIGFWGFHPPPPEIEDRKNSVKQGVFVVPTFAKSIQLVIATHMKAKCYSLERTFRGILYIGGPGGH